MPTLVAGNTVYTPSVAKVMISIPDDLLTRLDAQARANRETRSGFLQRVAERELQEDDFGRHKEVEKLLDLLAAEPFGGNAAQIIREERDSR
jgi:HicB_like antitoxin of bacterial toxin-antitoxin system